MTRGRTTVLLTALLCAATSLAAQPMRSDSAAVQLLDRVRVARLRHDAALASYNATSRQRVTMSIGVRAMGGERIAYRHEDVARIHWSRNGGSWVELLGARTFLGAFRGNFGGATDRDLADAVPLPYFPGRERLWSGDGMLTEFVGQARAASDSVNRRELVNPLARGAEEFYDYAVGDSVHLQLPDGQRILLRELRITARRPQWNLVVGSFWFDQATADLVRAIYRLSAPTDILAVTKARGEGRRPPAWLRGLVSPLRTDIGAIAIEYGLVDQRFWLPRIQWLEGTAVAGPARATVRIEHRFTYADVNGAVPPVPATTAEARTVTVRRYGGAIEVATTVPRDREALARSPLLPASILDPGDAAFDASAAREMLGALGLGLQPGWAPSRPTWSFGLPLTRYNRVEGLSTGLGLEHLLGRGYTVGALVRGSVADRALNGEATLVRSNGRTLLGAAVFRRLAAMNDWEDPLSLTASVPALLFGRDDGAYYRAAGGELTAQSPRWGGVRARLFGERQRAASTQSRWSLLGDRDFVLDNPSATPVTLMGLSLRATPRRGDDPRRWRLAADLAVEAATGTVRYGRALAELTASHGLGGPFVGALTAGAGSSAGTLPVQRAFYLGGTNSIRGQRALTLAGDAFWMARAELGADRRFVRPTLFADLGWAGDRDAWRTIGRPLSGVGVGASIFDGLVRVDVARGLHPSRRWRLHLHLDSRF